MSEWPGYSVFGIPGGFANGGGPLRPSSGKALSVCKSAVLWQSVVLGARH